MAASVALDGVLGVWTLERVANQLLLTVIEARCTAQQSFGVFELVAERDLAIDVMKEINQKKMVSAQGRRRQVGLAVERGLSRRFACALLGVARSTLSYRLRRPVADEQLTATTPRSTRDGATG